MNQRPFQIGIPRVGSAARLAEQGKPMARMPLPQAGSAARDAEARKKLDGAARPPEPVIGMRAQGGRRVSMEEMIAASKPVGSGISTGAEASATVASARPELPVAALPSQGRLEVSSKLSASTSATGRASRPSTPADHLPVTVEPYAQRATVAAKPVALSGEQSSVFPGPSRFSADRVKSLVRSLFSWNG